jgi:hypothetical protein
MITLLLEEEVVEYHQQEGKIFFLNFLGLLLMAQKYENKKLNNRLELLKLQELVEHVSMFEIFN